MELYPNSQKRAYPQQQYYNPSGAAAYSGYAVSQPWQGQGKPGTNQPAYGRAPPQQTRNPLNESDVGKTTPKQEARVYRAMNKVTGLNGYGGRDPSDADNLIYSKDQNNLYKKGDNQYGDANDDDSAREMMMNDRQNKLDNVYKEPPKVTTTAATTPVPKLTAEGYRVLITKFFVWDIIFAAFAIFLCLCTVEDSRIWLWLGSLFILMIIGASLSQIILCQHSESMPTGNMILYIYSLYRVFMLVIVVLSCLLCCFWCAFFNQTKALLGPRDRATLALNEKNSEQSIAYGFIAGFYLVIAIFLALTLSRVAEAITYWKNNSEMNY